MIHDWNNLNKIDDGTKKAAVMAELAKANRKRSLTRFTLNELIEHASFIEQYGQGFSSAQLSNVLERFTDSEREILFLVANGKVDDDLRKTVLSQNQRCRRTIQSILKKHGLQIDG